MKTLIHAAIRCSLMFTAVAALSIVYPASVQAVPTTYQYTGNHFTDVSGPYTTSMFVTAMVTLAGPLPPNFSGTVTPTAFTFFDGVNTYTKLNSIVSIFFFTTGPTGQIISWNTEAVRLGIGQVGTLNIPAVVEDKGEARGGIGLNMFQPGRWGLAVPDAGSTLTLMTLNLMALGLVARRFQRAAG